MNAASVPAPGVSLPWQVDTEVGLRPQIRVGRHAQRHPLISPVSGCARSGRRADTLAGRGHGLSQAQITGHRERQVVVVFRTDVPRVREQVSTATPKVKPSCCAGRSGSWQHGACVHPCTQFATP